MANDLVVKSNTLISASHYLSLVEQRLIGLAIVKAREIKMPLTDSVMLEVRASDYMEAFGVDRATAYQSLSEAVDKLFDRYFEYDLYLISENRLARGHSLSLLANKCPLCAHDLYTGCHTATDAWEEPGFGNKQAFRTQVSTDDPEIFWYLISTCPTRLLLSWFLGSDTSHLSWSHGSPLCNLKETPNV